MVRERFGEETDEFPVGGRREFELGELLCCFGVRWRGKKSGDPVAEDIFLGWWRFWRQLLYLWRRLLYFGGTGWVSFWVVNEASFEFWRVARWGTCG